ncbi:MAG: CNNM domain-containing protein [Chloroflexota bacterium]
MIPLPELLITDFLPILAVGGASGNAAGTWGGLLFYIGIALGLSFLCSVLEAILLSTSHSHVQMEAEGGGRGALLMQKHKADVERPISAILTLNTVAHTVGAAGAGAEAVAIFGEAWFGVISAILTVLILVFSEIIPKTIGATYWKQLNSFAAYGIEALVWLLFPAVWLLEKTTQMLKSSDEIPTISRLEIEAMARIGANEGALVEREDRILRNLFHLERVQVQDIMTPRTVVLAFQKENTVAEIVDSHSTIPYSRLPIYTENMDDIDGFVLRNELYRAYATGGQDKTLEDLKRPIEAVPETKEMSTVFDEFINNQQHILLVIDEYGGTAGVLTMEDALETLLGIEITDESDMVADLRKMAQQRFENQQKVLENISTKPLPKSASTAPVAKVDDNTETETDDAPVDEPEAQPESGD